MGKFASDELYREHTLEHFAAFKQSGEMERLRKKGLTNCGRKQRFTGNEWFESSHKRYSSPEYRKWADECEVVGQKFSLASWTVVCACLVSRYDPRKELMVIEADWPQIRIVTQQTNPLFLRWLSYEAHRLLLYVVQRQGSLETTILNISPPRRVLTPSEKPPRDAAFRLRFERPLDYPPEAAQELQKKGERLAKELLKRLGYPVPQRLRVSSLVAKADKLRVGKNLANREAYEVIDDIYGEDLSDDARKRKLIGSQRYKLRQRLIKPYEN